MGDNQELMGCTISHHTCNWLSIFLTNPHKMVPISLIKKEKIQVGSHERLHTGKTKNTARRRDNNKARDVHQHTLLKSRRRTPAVTSRQRKT